MREELQMEGKVSSHKLKKNTFINRPPYARNVFFKTSFVVGLLITDEDTEAQKYYLLGQSHTASK